MARKETETSSSSSSSSETNSDTDSSSSSSEIDEAVEVVTTGTSGETIHALLLKKKKKHKNSSSESATSFEDESCSSATSVTANSESDENGYKAQETGPLSEGYEAKSSPVKDVEDAVDEGKGESGASAEEPEKNAEEPVAEASEPSPDVAAQELKTVDPVSADVGGPEEVNKEPEAEVAVIPIPQEIVGEEKPAASPEPEIENVEAARVLVPDSEEPATHVEYAADKPAVHATNDEDEGEPETKKKKLEPSPETVPKAVEEKKESKNKDVSKRRSPKHRSRSPGRRDRKRSRDRDDRSRRQRSRSRSRDRRRRRSRTRSRSKNAARNKSQDRRRGRSPSKKDDESKDQTNPNQKITERQRRTVDLLTSRTGGAYIPPAKLRMMQAEITDKASAAYQRIAWEALKKSIHGYINKVNVDNIGIITRELLKENIVRGRGLLCRSIIQAQAASPTFTHVYAALVAIINSKFPNIGELLLKRLVIQFKRAFRRNDKAICLSASRFVAHLVNQRVAHEILALEILTLLVETPTDDSVEVAIAFLKECGMKLTEVSSKGIGAIFEMLKNILHEGKLDKRVQYMIEVVFQVRKDGFKDHQSVIEALELVEEDDQFTHLLMLDEATTTEDNLNAFKFDDKYETNEDKYKGLSKEILGSDASDSDDDSESGSDDSDSDDEEEKAKADAIIDNTETNLVALRRTIYLTINSSLDYEECAHKLMKMQLKPGQEIELCHMFLDCCAEQRTYEKFYGLLAQRFCSINKTYIEPFEEIFKDTYRTTHRLDTNRLRNVSKFFAHLLFTDAIGWDVIDCIQLNEDDTTSSSRIFIKILFQELAEYMGLGKLNEKLKDEVLTESLAGLFPKDNPRNTRFAINFFTSIGLGGLTDDLRQFLKNAPKNVPAINAELLPEKIDISSTESSSSSSSPSSSSSSESSSETTSSEEEDKQRKKKKKNKVVKKKESAKLKKKKSKTLTKTKKPKKKQETSSSESPTSESSSSSSSTTSSSESSTSSSDSSSEDDKKKKQSKKKVEVNKKKDKKEKSKESVVERDDKKGKEKGKKRDDLEERVSNGRSENGRGREDRKRDQDDKAQRERRDRKDDRMERSDRKDNRLDRSPNRDRRYREKYSQPAKSNHDYRSSGKSRNGSKERG